VKPWSLFSGVLLTIASFLAALSKPSPSFSRDVAPIIYGQCVSCHHPAGPAPFSLTSYTEVKQHANQIADAVRNRSMPPWLPQHGYGDFAGEQRLTEAQIRVLSEWAYNGTAEGSASDTPVAPHVSEGWQLGRPDMVVEAAEPFTVPASGPDVFWNFIFSPPITTRRYVRAIEILPGPHGMVHHANLIIDRLPSARRLEAAPGKGFPGMDLKIAHSPLNFPSHFLFWKPGAPPWVEPEGLAWYLDPGDDLVLNSHLMTMGMPMSVRPSIGLYFTDKPPAKLPILIELESDRALDIPPGDRDFVIRDTFRLPVDSDVLAVYPHAHYLGHLLEAYATLPNGERKWLIRIPDWDPKWQAVYHYREPVFLPAGSMISMRYHYDNSTANPRNPNRPPQRVQAGNQSSDEMGHLWLQLLPRGKLDRRREIEEALLRHRLEKNTGDFNAHVNLGALMLSEFNPRGAVSILEGAVKLQPMEPEGHNWLGVALEVVGRTREAIEQFQVALTLQPDYSDARYNLAKALVKSGDLDEALVNFRQVAAACPKDAGVHNDFGELLLRQGKAAQALEQFNQVLVNDPSNETARANRDLARRQLAQN
jgi:tetratricopeptide (TPR) repeat protein